MKYTVIDTWQKKVLFAFEADAIDVTHSGGSEGRAFVRAYQRDEDPIENQTWSNKKRRTVASFFIQKNQGVFQEGCMPAPPPTPDLGRCNHEF